MPAPLSEARMPPQKRAILNITAFHPDTADDYAAWIADGTVPPADRTVTASDRPSALLAAIETNRRTDMSSWLYVSSEMWDAANTPVVLSAARKVVMSIVFDPRIPETDMVLSEEAGACDYVIRWKKES